MRRRPIRRAPPTYPVRRAVSLAALTLVLSPGCGLFRPEAPGPGAHVDTDSQLPTLGEPPMPDLEPRGFLVPGAPRAAVLSGGERVRYQLTVETTDRAFATWLQGDPAALVASDAALMARRDLAGDAARRAAEVAVTAALVEAFYGADSPASPPSIDLVVTPGAEVPAVEDLTDS